MLAKLTIAVAVAMVAVGCNTASYVPKTIYDRDINALKELNTTLEERNRVLEPLAVAGQTMEGMQLISTSTDKLYQDIADALKKTLGGYSGDGEITYSNGKWTAGADLLFDSGSWTITPKGCEVLKKFAEAHSGRDVRFRIVGHTDCAPIAKAGTKAALDTDTNLELSIKRATAVMGQLKKCGLSEKQIAECGGMGNIQPVAPNDKNPANMKKNRRVEIFVLK